MLKLIISDPTLKSVCDNCKNKITLPSKLAEVDIELMKEHGWEVNFKNDIIIISKKCTRSNCNVRYTNEVDEFDEFQYA